MNDQTKLRRGIYIVLISILLIDHYVTGLCATDNQIELATTSVGGFPVHVSGSCDSSGNELDETITSPDELHVENNLTPEEARRQLTILMGGLSKPTVDGRPVDPELLLERLQKAEVVMNSLDADGLRHHKQDILKISHLLQIGMDSRCEPQDINTRAYLTGFYESDSNLTNYFQYFNENYYKHCGRSLQNMIEQAISDWDNLPMDILQAVKRSLSQEDVDHLESAKLPRDRVLLSLIEYLKEQQSIIGDPLVRGPGESIEDFAARFSDRFTGSLRRKCAPVVGRVERHLQKYRLLVGQYEGLRDQLKPEVISLLDLANICSIVIKHRDDESLFGLLMGQERDLSLMKSQLSSENPRPSLPLDLERLRDDLYIVSALERARDKFHAIESADSWYQLSKRLYKSGFVDIHEGCEPGSLHDRLQLVETCKSWRNVASYLQHYNSLQVDECLHQLARRLDQVFQSIPPKERRKMEELMKQFLVVDASRRTDSRAPLLYGPIPKELTTVSLASYLIRKRVKAKETVLLPEQASQLLRDQIEKHLGPTLRLLKRIDETMFNIKNNFDIVLALDRYSLVRKLDTYTIKNLEIMNVCEAIREEEFSFEELNNLIAQESSQRHGCLGFFCLK